jgi:N-acetylneuraminate lyase
MLHGILPAVVTPLTDEEEFAFSSAERLLEHVYDAGVNGVYVCGQTGEGLVLPLAIREAMAEVAVRNSPSGRSVIVHVGAHRTADAVRLARHASRLGASAVASLPPPGNYSFAEIQAYYQQLAKASDLPLLVYYFPEIAPGVSAAQVAQLTTLPNVIGVKYTDFDLFRLSLLTQSGATVFNGRDEVLAAGLLMGAHGGIGSIYNVVPDLFAALYKHASANEWREARKLQDRINELIAVLLRYPLVPALKQVLKWKGIDCGPCAAPRRRLTEAETAELRQSIVSFSQLSAVLSS